MQTLCARYPVSPSLLYFCQVVFVAHCHGCTNDDFKAEGESLVNFVRGTCSEKLAGMLAFQLFFGRGTFGCASFGTGTWAMQVGGLELRLNEWLGER
ncbi:hypothetical protein DUNSADRAFT_14659 [Dunaliella salina]|uniref:Secreted protein n=1 Tax=Dunaliella salina TaxID=3046 RepID=A0ABQ7G726_DUNSA|nr:hypothetical protein DUNSADRAFT_14659 [Dunaliella salina]|eukprot:KAF5830395.1 hypothetical protein DUNSADRAFT_14659 [Dunaliella salina]